MAYKDLSICFSREDKHHFVASAVEGGKSVAFNSFELRSDELRIIERLREMEKAAVKPESLVTFHKDFGQELYGKVLAGDLKSYFQKQLKANGEGLRISLQFDDDAQWLATLPWEFLHDGEDFLVARRNTLLSRMPPRMKRVQSLPIESVLSMLVIVSAPQDKSCAPLDTEKERDRILQAVDRLYVQRKMEVDFTDDATFETIQSYLNEKDYHIVHFTGHGSISTKLGPFELLAVDQAQSRLHGLSFDLASMIFFKRAICSDRRKAARSSETGLGTCLANAQK